jgi:hypothetical protein
MSDVVGSRRICSQFATTIASGLRHLLSISQACKIPPILFACGICTRVSTARIRQLLAQQWTPPGVRIHTQLAFSNRIISLGFSCRAPRLQIFGQNPRHHEKFPSLPQLLEPARPQRSPPNSACWWRPLAVRGSARLNRGRHGWPWTGMGLARTRGNVIGCS